MTNHLFNQAVKEAPTTLKLFATDNDFSITIVRPVLGIAFFAHGARAGAASVDRLLAVHRSAVPALPGAR